jgi:hypothetical protein
MDECESAKTIKTNIGWSGRGENFFRGYSVPLELVGSHGYWTMISLAAGHRPLDPHEAEFLDRLAVAANASDPRIWPLKFAWLAASYGSTINAMGALLVWLDGSRVGPSPTRDAAIAWMELGALDGTDAIIRWFADRKTRGENVQGFGVPGRDRDERVELGKQLVEAYGRAGGRYYRLFTEVEGILRQRGRLRPNIVGLVSACALDLGFEPSQAPFVMWPGLEISMVANVVEANARQPEVIRELPSERVRYRGPAPRSSPRALDAT